MYLLHNFPTSNVDFIKERSTLLAVGTWHFSFLFIAPCFNCQTSEQLFWQKKFYRSRLHFIHSNPGIMKWNRPRPLTHYPSFRVSLSARLCNIYVSDSLARHQSSHDGRETLQVTNCILYSTVRVNKLCCQQQKFTRRYMEVSVTAMWKVKVNFNPEQATKAQRGVDV